MYKNFLFQLLLKEGFHSLAHICIIYLPVHVFLAQAQFSIVYQPIIRKLPNFACVDVKSSTIE